MAIEKLNKTYVNNQTKLNAEDFKENVNKINEIIDISECAVHGILLGGESPLHA